MTDPLAIVDLFSQGVWAKASVGFIAADLILVLITAFAFIGCMSLSSGRQEWVLSPFLQLCPELHCPCCRTDRHRVRCGTTPEAQAQWRLWDAVALLEDGYHRKDQLLVDMGSADPFLQEQLRPKDLSISAANHHLLLAS